MAEDYQIYRLSASDMKHRSQVPTPMMGNHSPFYSMIREKSLAELLIADEIDVDFETVMECYELGGELARHMLRRWMRQQIGVSNMTSDETVAAIVKWLEAREIYMRTSVDMDYEDGRNADAYTWTDRADECRDIKDAIARGDWRVEAGDDQ